MGHMRVYTVACSIYENGKIVNVSLDKLLDIHGIQPNFTGWSEDYDLEYIVRYYIFKGFKVRYIHMPIYVTTYEDYQLPPFSSINLMGLGDTASYMNRLQDMIFSSLTSEEAEKLLCKYGNDYTKQIKGERYSWKTRRDGSYIHM